MERNHRFWKTVTGEAGPIGLVVAAVGLALVSAIRPLGADDLWWHLTLGRIADVWQVAPAQNLLLYTAPIDAPSTVIEWLSQWWLYNIFETAGGLGLVVSRSILFFALGLAAMAAAMSRDDISSSTEIKSIAFVVFVVGAAHGALNPALFGALLACVVLAFIHHVGNVQRKAWWLVLVVPIAGFWANVDASFFVPSLACLLGAIAGPRRAYFAAGFVASTAATMVSPRTYEVWVELGQIALRGDPVWQNPNPAAWVAALVFAWVVGRAVVEWGTAFERGLALTFFAWGIWYQPHAILWVPVAAVAFSSGVDHKEDFRAGVSSWLGALALVIVAVFAQPLTESHLDVRAALGARASSPERGVLPRGTPLAHVQTMAAAGGSLRVFHDRKFAGLIAWHVLDPLAPEPMLFLDPRVGLVSRDLERLHAQVIEDPSLWRGVFQQYRINTVLLSTERELSRAIVADPDWILVIEDAGVMLAVRRPRATTDLDGS